MRTFHYLCLILVISSTVVGKNVPTKKTNNERAIHFCSGISLLAKGAMMLRQDGETSLEEALINSEVNNSVPDEINDWIQGKYEEILLEAYSKPDYSGESFKKKAIKNFADKWMLRCMNSKKDIIEKFFPKLGQITCSKQGQITC